jgi:hypothetical protein
VRSSDAQSCSRSWAKQAARDHVTYDRIGPDVALERAIVDTWFGFWQSDFVDNCLKLPRPEVATAAELFTFIQNEGFLFPSTDKSLADEGQAYAVQCATELGRSRSPDRHLRDLLRYTDTSSALPLPGLRYDPAPMRDFTDWLKTDGRATLFLYGQNDPWRLEAPDVGDNRTLTSFIVPGGNHYSTLGDLPEPDATAARALIKSWGTP